MNVRPLSVLTCALLAFAPGMGCAIADESSTPADLRNGHSESLSGRVLSESGKGGSASENDPDALIVREAPASPADDTSGDLGLPVGAPVGGAEHLRKPPGAAQVSPLGSAKTKELFVQLHVFKNAENVFRAKNKLQTQGMDSVFVDQGHDCHGNRAQPELYRLCLGPFDNSTEARAQQRRAKVILDAPDGGRSAKPPKVKARVEEGRHKPGSTVTPSVLPPPKRRKPDAGSAVTMRHRLELYYAQIALQRLGFNPKGADGVHGPATAAAMSAFQRDNRLEETGRLDPATRKQLEQALYEHLISATAVSGGTMVVSDNVEETSVPELPAFEPKPGDRVIALEKVSCETETQAFVLFYRGPVTAVGADDLAVAVDGRLGLWYDPSRKGSSEGDWWCVPRHRYCYGAVDYHKWDGLHRSGESFGVARNHVIPESFGPIALAYQAIVEQCGSSASR